MKYQHFFNVLFVLLMAYMAIQICQINMKLQNALILPEVTPVYEGGIGSIKGQFHE